MIKKFTHRQKSPAQAMVEFALVLPILLLVVYGLLEVGRLLFIYSSVVTSARSASRYASTTGLNNAGTFPRYQDCAGMRAAARNSAFIDSYEDADIQIQWDKGEGQSTTSYCTSGASDVSFNLQDDGCSGNNCRVRVTVSTQYTPIVPLVPLEPFVITSTSARTILVSVAIQMTSPPMTWDPNQPTFTPIASATLVPSATSTLQYTQTPTDTATPTLSPTATLSPTITLTPTATGTPTNTATATPPVPADFVKSGPDNGTINQPVTLTLTWSSSAGASYYEYCLSTSLPCSGWSSTGLTTNAALSGLSPNTTYYWHVRATNIYGATYSNGSTAEVWSFTTGGACDVRHSTPIKFSGASLNISIFNYSATTTIHISSIQLYWNPSSPAGQKLKEIFFGGIKIWSGERTTSPSLINSFIGDVSLAPSASKLISFNFDKNYKDNGSEKILITFAEPGCPILDSDNDSQLP